MAKLTVVLISCVLALTGCVSMASSGPVRSYNVTQGTSGSAQQYFQVDALPPGNDWSPLQIVQGFIAANASFADQHSVARQYLTGRAVGWDPGWSATVFSGTPDVRVVRGSSTTAVVAISGAVQASVGQSGAYAVPQAARESRLILISLVKAAGQWRISDLPRTLLLSAVDFAADYQPRNLYFLNPAGKSLVADPVYVPLDTARADPNDVLEGLVSDLIVPPADWLSNGATMTAFPAGTKLLGVTLAGGTATVNLGGRAVTATEGVRQQITAQLLWTLSGSGVQPAVTAVELQVNGKVWVPPNGTNVPVQQMSSYSGYAPPDGAGSGDFYYLDSHGDVLRRSGPNANGAVKVFTATAKSPRFSDIAASPDGKYLAGTSGGWAYMWAIGGRPRRRVQGTFTALSWDSSDQLWMAGPGGVEMTGWSSSTATPVSVLSGVGGQLDPAPVTALRVAPDGVRVALVLGGTKLAFGAIATTSADVTITEYPFSVEAANVTGLTWYGPNDVIAVSGGAAIEYPVNGGTITRIQSATGMVNITASWGSPLIASSANGELSYNESVSGAWVQLNVSGESVAYSG
jgi:hypothetical protein